MKDVAWTQLISNGAVLVGLLFVGFQLYQDRQLKIAELAFMSMDTALSVSLSVIGDSPHEAVAKVLSDPENLTDEDIYILSNVFDSHMFVARQLHLMHDIGVFPEVLGDPPPSFGTEIGRRYIETQVPSWGVGGLREHLAQVAAKKNFDTTFRDYIDGLAGNSAAD